LLSNFPDKLKETGFVVQLNLGTGFKEGTIPLFGEVGSIIVLHLSFVFEICLIPGQYNRDFVRVLGAENLIVQTALLDILDTAGQEEFSSMQDQWMRDGKGFLLVYNITSRPTFDEVSILYDKILRTKDTDKVPVVLAGNKADLKDERQVEYNDGANLAKQWNCPFFETSAKIKLNNEACFFELVREIRKQTKKGPVKGPKKSICTIL